MDLERNADKDAINRERHGMSFDEASEPFASDEYLEIYDEEHSIDEDRFIAVGPIRRGIIVVVFTNARTTCFGSSAPEGRYGRRHSSFAGIVGGRHE